jgi:hypothetical protein
MLVIEIEEYKRANIDGRKILKCPYCGEDVVFYIGSPIRCHSARGCRKVLPDITAIMEMPKARLAYHFQDDPRITGTLPWS